MTTNYRIDLPLDLEVSLGEALEQVNLKNVQYDLFVEGLMKGLPTPADELMHATVGISGEAGELLDAAKKSWIYNKPLDLFNVVEELGDLRFYYQALMNMLGITDEEVRAYNVCKLLKRYGDGVYTDAAAQARADKQVSEAKLVPQSNGRTFFGKVSDKENVLLASPGQAVVIETKLYGGPPTHDELEFAREMATGRDI